MAHEHLSEEELARYATEPESVPRERQQFIERETAACSICRTTLDFLSVMTPEDLADDELWEPEATWRPEDEGMRAYIERLTVEDREADRVLAERRLLESPTRTAWTNLQRDRRFLSGGIVRRLIAHANSIYQDQAYDALTFADAAISIAESLPDNAYPWDAVFDLRGAAWKERANALLVLGEFPAAHEALTQAERAYRHLNYSTFGLSAVALTRSSVLLEQDRLDEAVIWAEKAEQGFAKIGHEARRIHAVFARGSIKFEAGDIAGVIPLFEQVLDYGEETSSPEWIARASYAIGNCEVERRNLGEASMRFLKALAIFRETGPDRDRLAAEWGLARVVLYGGNQAEALRQLRMVASEMEKRSMITLAALVRLDIVEVLLAMHQWKQIVEMTTRLFGVFRAAGMMTGALTAIAYMKDAAAGERLTSAGVNAVRTYIRRSTRQPALVFEPPPDL